MGHPKYIRQRCLCKDFLLNLKSGISEKEKYDLPVISFSFLGIEVRRKILYLQKHVKKGGDIMARPIEPTPILEGKDAERFLRLINTPRPISKEEKERMLKNYEFFMSISSFKW